MGNKSREKSSNGEVVKPLLDGCVTGQLYGVLRVCFLSIDTAPNTPTLRLVKNIITQTPPLLKRELLCGSILSTASLGTFQILTNRLRHSNSGGPLTLYQEAGCALISGTTTAFAWHPFRLAYTQLGPNNFTYTSLFTALARTVKNEGAMGLWRGSGLNATQMAAAYAGILASHDRSLNYLTQTQALPTGIAEISASVISGFIGAACFHPLPYLGGIIKAVHAHNAYARIPYCIGIVLRDANFYRSFFKKFGWATMYAMAQFSIFRDVRKLEWEV